MDLNKMELSSNLVEGLFLERGRFPRDFLLKQNYKSPSCWLYGTYTTELFS